MLHSTSESSVGQEQRKDKQLHIATKYTLFCYLHREDITSARSACVTGATPNHESGALPTELSQPIVADLISGWNAREFSSPELAFWADSYSVSIPSLC